MDRCKEYISSEASIILNPKSKEAGFEAYGKTLVPVLLLAPYATIGDE